MKPKDILRYSTTLFVPSGWNGDPADLAETFAIFDAQSTPASVFSDAGVTPAGNGDTVVEWHDVFNSPPYKKSASSSIYRPKYSSNNNGYVYFVNDKLDAVASGWPGNFSTAAVTVAMAVTYDEDIAAQSFFDGASANDLLVRIQTDGSVWQYADGTGYQSAAGMISQAGPGRYIIIATFDGANSKLHISPYDLLETPRALSGTCGTGGTLTLLELGCDGAGSNRLRATSGIEYLAVIKKALSDSERGSVGSWLASQYSQRWRF